MPRPRWVLCNFPSQGYGNVMFDPSMDTPDDGGYLDMSPEVNANEPGDEGFITISRQPFNPKLKHGIKGVSFEP